MLERDGLVETRTGTDGREAGLELTSSGKRKLKHAMPLWQQAQRRVEKRLGRAELLRLETLLADL